MTIVERRVRSLRVRAPDDDRARHAAIVIEDALRTASLPGVEGSRVVVIRRLDLGRVPAGASSASVSLVVEAAAQRAASAAVRGDSSAADDAPAIYFQDGIEPVLALARRVARGVPANEWFWPLVVRGWFGGASPNQSAALLLERAWKTSAGVVAMAQVVATFAAAGTMDLLVASMSESDARSLLARGGWRAPEREANARDVEMPRVPSRTAAVIRDCLDRWGGATTDVRTTWVAGMLLVAERPSRASSAMLPVIVRGVVESIARGESLAADRTHGQVQAGEATDGGAESIVGEMKRRERERGTRVDSVFGGAPPRPAQRVASATPSLQPPPEVIEPTDLDPPFWGVPRHSARAGAIFLVPLLSRLGIASLLADNADLVERQWPDTLIVRITMKLGAYRIDPALAWLNTESLELVPDDRALTANWIRALRARCRRETNASLAALVRRPGAIVVTRTHVDVLFRHSQVDIAVRRAGLDIDPGWVPWLGRVVRVHYLDVLPDDAA